MKKKAGRNAGSGSRSKSSNMLFRASPRTSFDRRTNSVYTNASDSPFYPFGGSVEATTTMGSTEALFNPPEGTDTLLKRGVKRAIRTRHQCLTAMPEYEAKSLEELRLEDYMSKQWVQDYIFERWPEWYYKTQVNTIWAWPEATAVIGQTGFNPPENTDYIIKRGLLSSISIRHQCITAMGKHEDKSLEELRLENYQSKRRLDDYLSARRLEYFLYKQRLEDSMSKRRLDYKPRRPEANLPTILSEDRYPATQDVALLTLANSPHGYRPLLKYLNLDRREEVLKPTNFAAQMKFLHSCEAGFQDIQEASPKTTFSPFHSSANIFMGLDDPFAPISSEYSLTNTGQPSTSMLPVDEVPLGFVKVSDSSKSKQACGTLAKHINIYDANNVMSAANPSNNYIHGLSTESDVGDLILKINNISLKGKSKGFPLQFNSVKYETRHVISGGQQLPESDENESYAEEHVAINTSTLEN